MITIYSRQSCPNCDKVKTWFTHSGLHYTVKDIDEDEVARQEAMMSGLRALPIIRYGEAEDLYEAGYNTSDLEHIAVIEGN